jgi:EAL domain-containing protein (putative c-di-GMP-specific phosphodiesterase class I)
MPCIDIDDMLYQRLLEVAKQMGVSPEKLIQAILEEWLAPYNSEKEREVLQRLRELGYE